MHAKLPDALADALGRVVSDARRECRTELARIQAEHRAALAELRAEMSERVASLKSCADGEVSRVREALARVRDGRDGRDADPDLVREMAAAEVARAVSELPPREPEPASPSDGNEVDMEAVERLVGEQVERAVAAIQAPRDGKDADPEMVKELVTSEVERAVAALPPPKDGKDVDPEIVTGLVLAEVERAVARIPAPKDGEQGPQGEPGADADPERLVELVLARMPPTERGEPGRDGRSISEIRRLGDELIVVMNDGATFSTGGVRGDKGDPGRDVDMDTVARMIDAAVEKIPVPNNGKDADPALIDALVDEKLSTAISAIPAPRDGRDGKDADMDVVERRLGEMLAESVSAIPLPRDGKDADPAVTASLVTDAVNKAISELPPPQAGEPGRDGTGIDDLAVSGDGRFVVSLTDGSRRDLGTILGPPGPTGRDGQGIAGVINDDGNLIVRMTDGADFNFGRIIGPRGERGDPGARGEIGERGVDGRDGVGLAGALIDRDGAMIVTLSDGTTRALGTVVGRDGAPGADGKDGLGFDDFVLEPEYDGERALRLKWTDAAGKEQVREWRMPVALYRGIWNEAGAYEAGDMVTWAGSCWLAERDTPGKPSAPDSGWRLAVKAGRPGKDGTPGEKGERGPEGRPGRDFTIGGGRP